MSLKRHLTAGIALGLGLAALTGSALAAPPSTPPGQEKKAEQAATAPAPAETAAPASESAPAEQNKGQEQKALKAEVTSGINATTAGVKPTNGTQKHTKCWTGGSSSSPTCQPGPSADSSKRYGNGTTAAQVAASHGAPAGTEIRGPGNSQPHKVCGENGHFVDVHAVKTYVGISCTGTAGTAGTAGTTGTTGTTATQGIAVTAAPAGSSTRGTAATGTAGVPSTTAAGGVAGVSTESGSPQGGAGGPGGVLGAFGVAGVAAGGVLPFTGLPLWLAVLVAIGLIAVGWTLHRRGRPATRELV